MPSSSTEEGRVDFARGVVHGDDQVERRLAGEPLMPRAVLVHHHARKRAAWALAPVRAAPGRRSPAPISLQGQPHPVVAALAAVLRHQLLVEVLGGEVPVAGVEQLEHPRHFVHRRATCREAAQAAVVETLRAVRLKAIPPAPEGALRDAQDLRRLRLAQHTATGAPANLFELHQSQPLCLLRPAHPNPPWLGNLLKPDRSSGTWTGHIPCYRH